MSSASSARKAKAVPAPPEEAPASRSGGQLSKFTAIFAGGTLFSRVLGLARDIILIGLVPKMSMDAFVIAFRLPNMLRDIVGEGAMNAAFIPTFSAARETGDEGQFRELVSATLSAMLVLLLIITLAGVLLMPVLLQGVRALESFTPHDGPGTYEMALTTSMARWIFPYLFFIGLAVFMMGALFTVGRYTTPSWSPALLNISLIGACLFFHYVRPGVFPDMGYALVVGVWLGGIAQVAVMYIDLGRSTGVWLPSFHLRHPAIHGIFGLMLPVLIGQAAGEVNKLVNTFFAYNLPQGTVTQLWAANNLVQLPLSMFGFATAAAILPAIAGQMARAETNAARTTLMLGFRQSIFLVLPSALGLIVLGIPVVRLLYERGQFTALDTQRTAAAVAIYAAGLLPFALVKVAVTGFYGAKDTRTPVIVGSLSMVLNIALCFLLVRPMGFRGLCLATTISYTVNFAVLYGLLCTRYGRLWDRGFVTALLRMAACGITAVAIAYALYVRLRGWADGGFAAQLVHTAVPVAAAAGVYFLLCRLVDVKEVEYFVKILQRRRKQ